MLACTGKGRTPSPEKRDRRQLLINSEQVTSQVMPWTELPGLCRRAPPVQPGNRLGTVPSITRALRTVRLPGP